MNSGTDYLVVFQFRFLKAKKIKNSEISLNIFDTVNIY